LKIKSKIWIESKNGIVLGEGRVQLLKKIDETGSLNKASKVLNISYQKAWRLLDEINKAAEKPLIESKIGGLKGGGTSLTPYGKSLIVIFETINKDCWKFLDEQLKKHAL
jgi:molybdate transport system regulatory protein|tara:strand:- start:50720 stop:51049 length:330 start_codon:yes stop_codon:yes gene_type:complete